MGDSKQRFQGLTTSLFETLLQLYPPRFRGEFSAEIRAVFADRMRESDERGGTAWLATAFQEITQLLISILREGWHEQRLRKEKTMVPEDQLQKDIGAEGSGMIALQPARTPSMLWLAAWTLFMTAAIPAASIAMAPLAIMFTWLQNLGVKAGFWPAAQQSTMELFGYLFGFAIVLASGQGYLLRRFLPKARSWFIATGAGVLLGALAIGLSLQRFSVQSWDPFWIMAAVLLPFGLALGLAQWLYLRRFLPNAYWIILIDTLAAGSILLTGGTFTSLVELIVIVLPGVITGLGLWLLLSQHPPKQQSQVRRVESQRNSQRLSRRARVGIGVVALVPLFFVCIWVYTTSRLVLAKNEGIYTSVEEAVIATNSQGFGGAEVVSIEDVRASVNQHDGSQSHVWFGGATVYMDRVPDGYSWDHYSAGSYYIRVKDGWVHVPEGAFPEFIGWVMELYNMEGVNQ